MPADLTVADAICDRLVHNAHVLSLKGPSIRKTKGWERRTRTIRADHRGVPQLHEADRRPEGSRRCAPITPGCSGTTGRALVEWVTESDEYASQVRNAPRS